MFNNLLVTYTTQGGLTLEEDAIQVRIKDMTNQQFKTIAITKAFLLDDPDRAVEYLEKYVFRYAMEIANQLKEDSNGN